MPLIVLTADRPPELREVGAGQTIDQLKLYGDAVKWFFEVGVHDATPRARCAGSARSPAAPTGPRSTAAPGPVHLNFPLREPLVLDRAASRRRQRPSRRPSRTWSCEPPRPGRAGADRPPGRTRSGRIVIVAGRTAQPTVAARARRVRGAQPGSRCSPIRCPARAAGAAAIAHYDLLLRDPAFADAHRPEFVIRVGDLPTSKPLRALARRPRGRRADRVRPRRRAGRTRTRVVGHARSRARPAHARSRRATPTPSWLDVVAGGRRRGRGSAIDDDARRRAVASRSSPARSASGCRPTRPCSSPPRCRSATSRRSSPARDDAPRVLSNRGANGIDGTVSTRVRRRAAAGDGPVVLLIGDVALAHDIGGLLAARRLGLPLTIVLLNNDGGGIFHFLPVAGETDAFEEHVATPHGLDFERAAALYGCELRAARRRSATLRDGARALAAGAAHHDHRGADRPRAEPRPRACEPPCRTRRSSCRRAARPAVSQQRAAAPRA